MEKYSKNLKYLEDGKKGLLLSIKLAYTHIKNLIKSIQCLYLAN